MFVTKVLIEMTVCHNLGDSALLDNTNCLKQHLVLIQIQLIKK